MPLTNKFRNLTLDVLTGKKNFSSTSIYVGLSTTTPAVDGTNFTEPTGNGYGRSLLGVYDQSYTQKMEEAVGGETKNKEIIYFPEATGEWGIITYFGIFDAETNGNLLAYGALTSTITPITSSVPLIKVGDLIITLS